MNRRVFELLRVEKIKIKWRTEWKYDESWSGKKKKIDGMMM